MTRFARGAAIFLMLFAVGPSAGQDRITAANLTDEHVTKAIDSIVEELYARRQPGRFWDPEPPAVREGPNNQAGGYTALAALALLYAGQSYQEPRLRAAIDHLADVPMEGVYAVGCRSQAWAQLPASFLGKLEADARWLMAAFHVENRGWAYDMPVRRPWDDNSLRQYGALGLWEAAKRDVDVDRRLWQMLEDSFIEGQRPDGGWNYGDDEQPSTGSMTAAGLTVLMITRDFLHADEYVELGASQRSRSDLAIARGLEWFDRNFSATTNPPGQGHYFYYLYGVERVGLASGFKTFGGHDWFREGAAELLRRLCVWDAATRTVSVQDWLRQNRAAHGQNADLAFALMFLSRGRVPVAVNKLSVPGIGWNGRPHDVARLTAFIGRHAESAVNWQIVPLDSAPETWLDAPVLYLSSHEALPWDEDVAAWRRQRRQYERRRARGGLASDETPPPGRPDVPQLDRLRTYLDLGGLLLAVNEGTARRFAASVQAMGELLYPEAEWRSLESDHFVYTTPQPVGTRRLPLKGLSNGVRELIIIADRHDLGRSLQTRRKFETGHFQTASNVYNYASELGRPRPRLATRSSATADAASITKRASIAHAVHDGNWNPEPAALPLLAAHLAAAHGIAATITDVPLDEIDRVEPRPDLVVVNGIDAKAFDEAERTAIASYVGTGGDGVILFETPGGRGGFTESAEQMAESLVGRVGSLSRTRLVTGRGLPGGARLSRVEYRPYALQIFGGRENAPRLHGVVIGDLPRMLFSREDISHALLDQPCWGVSGYATSSARDLMTNIVLHAITPAKPAQ